VPRPLISKVDCVQIPVDDLDAGLQFYCERLGHDLVWRTATSAALSVPDGDVELVLQTERPALEPNFLVASVEEAARDFVAAGGELVAGPFDTQIGRCAVVRDPWRNHLVLLDMSKGRLVTDAEGNVIGNEPAEP
jgi:predicted enzyme related to lactoylglutathione lyase